MQLRPPCISEWPPNHMYELITLGSPLHLVCVPTYWTIPTLLRRWLRNTPCPRPIAYIQSTVPVRNLVPICLDASLSHHNWVSPWKWLTSVSHVQVAIGLWFVCVYCSPFFSYPPICWFRGVSAPAICLRRPAIWVSALLPPPIVANRFLCIWSWRPPCCIINQDSVMCSDSTSWRIRSQFLQDGLFMAWWCFQGLQSCSNIIRTRRKIWLR